MYCLYYCDGQAVRKNFANSQGNPLIESFTYITVAGQMAGNIIQKKSLSQIFSCKFCEFLQKGLSQSASWLAASDFRQRFRRIVSNTCLRLPQTFSNVSQGFWSENIQRQFLSFRKH